MRRAGFGMAVTVGALVSTVLLTTPGADRSEGRDATAGPALTTATIDPPAPSSPGLSTPGDEVQEGSLPSAIYDPTDHQGPTSIPASIRIDALDVVAAEVRPVGLDAEGGMEVPPVDQVGWYVNASWPDAGQGVTVLAAHVAYDGVDGVFARLSQARPGDEVKVALDDGSTATYRIERVDTFDKRSLPDDLFRTDGDPALVLITCGGAFDSQARSYVSNVVAQAVPV